MADEYFYGAVLKGANSEVSWDPEMNDKEEFPRANKLIVKQLLLGVDANQDEYNVVEVEAVGISDAIKIPIAVLKVGEQRTVQSFLEFPDAPVTFRLIQGAGPVYIHGHHLLGEFEEMEDNELGDEDEELEDIEQEEIPEDENDEQPKKKAKLAVNSNNSKGNAVKAATNNKPKK